MNKAIPTEIQTLLARKAKADTIAPEIRQQYAESYNLIVAELVRYSLIYPLSDWDYEINSEILSITLKNMAQKYAHKKPYIEWMCQSLIPEIDVSFTEKDQARFCKCIQVARKQMESV